MVSLFKEVIFGVIALITFFTAIVFWLAMFALAEAFYWTTMTTLYSAYQTRWLTEDEYINYVAELKGARE